MQNRLIGVLSKFSSKKIIVIGDIMLDKYIWGDVSRISPEAPVQIVKVVKETFAPGGAANVASNASSLGSRVFMVGITGNDAERDILLNELKKRGIDTTGIFTDHSRPTTLKVRVLGRSQQLLRIDYEEEIYSNDNITDEMIKFFMSKINNIDAVIVSDYAKGVINQKLMSAIIESANEKNKIIVIDPKPKNKDLYKNVTLITPNHNEALMMSRTLEEDSDLMEIGENLVRYFNASILLTKGEKGMSLFEKNGEVTDIPTKAKEVYDVVGAGDTVVAAVTLALCAGANLKEAALLSNIAAGIKVGKVGASAVAVDEIRKALQNE